MEQEKLRNALNVIEESIGGVTADILMQGLPKGSHKDREYDEKLIIDLAEKCINWKKRLMQKAISTNKTM